MSTDIAKTVANNKYNKGIYTGIVGAGLTLIFVSMGDYNIVISPELQGAITTFLMMLTTIIVPNKENK